MGDSCIYCVQICDSVDEDRFNATSPQRIKIVQADEEATRFTICADQSGLIGMLRWLHGQGFKIRSVAREQFLKE
jgi:hypothetical protein